MADSRAGGRSGGPGTVGDRPDCAIHSGGLSAYARSATGGFDRGGHLRYQQVTRDTLAPSVTAHRGGQGALRVVGAWRAGDPCRPVYYKALYNTL